MFRKTIKSMAALLAAAAMSVATCAPAWAVTGGSAAFDKYLVLEKQANVPNATFNFTIAAGQAIPASVGADDANTSPQVLAGVQPTAVTITPATFSPADQTKTAVATGDVLTLGADEKYADKTVTVSFANVDFPAPGIYRYLITESATSIPGVTNDATTTRTMDVYVTSDAAGALSVSGYVLHDGTDIAKAAGASGGADSYGNKPSGFTNRYATSDLTIAKNVDGAMASRAKYFKLDLSITDAAVGTKYTVDLSNAEATTSAGTNPAEITVQTGGTATASFYLKHGQSVKVQGVTANTVYTVAEDLDANEGYRPYYKLDSGTTQGTKTQGSSCQPAGDHTIGADDDVVTFTNERNVTVPTDASTGIFVTAGVGVAALAALVAFFASKKKKEEKQA